AFTTRIADGAIKGVIAEQQFDHALARLLDLVTLRGDDHAFADDCGACSLQLWHLLNLHQAHAAGALQRKIRVIAERRHFDADSLTSLNEKSAGGCRDRLAINREAYEFGRRRH